MNDTKGFWKIDDLVAAKKLVKRIARAADDHAMLSRDDEIAIIEEAREIMQRVRTNAPANDLLLDTLSTTNGCKANA